MLETSNPPRSHVAALHPKGDELLSMSVECLPLRITIAEVAPPCCTILEAVQHPSSSSSIVSIRGDLSHLSGEKWYLIKVTGAGRYVKGLRFALGNKGRDFQTTSGLVMVSCYQG